MVSTFGCGPTKKKAGLKEHVIAWLIRKLGPPEQTYQELLDRFTRAEVERNRLAELTLHQIDLATEKFSEQTDKLSEQIHEDTRSACCRLEHCDKPTDFGDRLTKLQVEVLSSDGTHRFIRPFSHPDVLDCLESGNFYCRKFEG